MRSQGKGSYKHKALISIGSYLLNEQKGAKKKALISMQALIKVGSYKNTPTVKSNFSFVFFYFLDAWRVLSTNSKIYNIFHLTFLNFNPNGDNLRPVANSSLLAAVFCI